MRKFQYLCLLPLLLGLFTHLPTTLHATHVMGSDITWECLGNDSFLIRVTVYRDCNGINLSAGSISVQSIGCASNISINATTQMGPALDITPVCDNSCTRCNNSGCTFQYGIEQRIITTIVYLGNTTCCNFRISWGQCCRNSNITTGPNDQNFYVEAKFNKCTQTCNNSPKFTQLPVAILCVGQCVVYNQGLVDPDGDSLVYSLVSPLINANSPVTYNSSFAYNRPLTFNGFPNQNLPYNPPLCRGFHLDPITGDLMFRPMQQQITVMSIMVEKWRDGVRIGETRRDIQLIVINCPNNDAPTLSGINGGTSFQAEVCANSQICFTINSDDLQVNDSLTMTWNNAIPGATFTTTTGKRPVGTFCWTPTENDASSIPYFFTVKVEDNACPVKASTIRAYRVLVKPLPTSARTVTDSGCGQFAFSSITNPPSATVFWNLNGPGGGFQKYSKQFTHQFKRGGMHPHEFTVMSGGCERIYKDTLIVSNLTRVELGRDTVVCHSSTFDILPTVHWGQATSFLWHSGHTGAELLNVTLTKDSTFHLTIQDENGCKNSDTIFIKVNSPPLVNLGSDRRICGGDTTLFVPTITHLDAGDSSVAFNWYNLFDNSLIGINKNIRLSDSGSYYLNVFDQLGCMGSDTVNLFVNPEITIYPPDPTICITQTVNLTATWSPNATYKWTVDGLNTVISTDSILKVSPLSTTTYRVNVMETWGGVNCEKSKTVKVTVNDTPSVQISNIPDRCINGNIITLNQANPGGGVWSGPGVSQLGTTYRFTPSVAGAGTHNLHYTLSSTTNGCVSRNTKTAKVNPLPIVSAGGDITRCTNEPNIPLSGFPAFGEWFTIGATPTNLITGTAPLQQLRSNGIAEGIYRIVYRASDQNNCFNNDTIRVFINQSPNVVAGEYNAVCEGSAPITLSGTPSGTGGTWSGSSFLNGNTFNPAQAGIYNLKYCYKTPSSCEECKTTTVVVNPKPIVNAYVVGNKNPVCDSETKVELASNVSGGSWSGNGVIGSIFNPSVAKDGTHEIMYSYTDANGCQASSNVNILVKAQPKVVITSGELLCIGVPNSLEADFQNATGIQWNTRGDGTFNNTTSKHVIYSPGTVDSKNEQFWIVIQTTGNSNGLCAPAFDSTLIKMHPTPQPDFTVDNPSGCASHTVKFTDKTSISSGNILKQNWDFGDGKTSSTKSPSHTYEKFGTYSITLKVESNEGCKAEITKYNFIEVYQVPNAAFEPDRSYTTVVLPNITFNNHSTNTVNPTFLWNFNDHTKPNGGISSERNPTYMFEDTGRFEVSLTVTNQNGCSAMAYRYITVDPDITIYIPNAFTPQTHGPWENNQFLPIVKGVISYQMQVYNRWGEILFQTDDLNEAWDGKYRGQYVDEGVYVYVIYAKSFALKDYKYTGTITILK